MSALLVIPLVPLSADGKGKKPAIKGWQERARPLAEWLADPEWAAHDRWGAPCGPRNRFWVLDIDPRHGGLESLAALEEKYGPLGVVYCVRTPSGGLHYYFLWQDICAQISNTAGKLGPGLDIRVDGGQVGVPPTPGYEVRDEVPLTLAPAWLLALLLPSAGAGSPRPATDEEPIRNARAHFARALQAALEEIRAAPDGQKDATMNRNAYGIGRIAEACGFSLEQVAQPLIDLCIELGYTPEKVLSCIPRALADGAKNPRTVAAASAPAVEPQTTAVAANAPAMAAEAPLRPCPPKPGKPPVDLTSEAGRRWAREDNEYREWHRDLRTATDARIVVVEYDQSRVLYLREGLRRLVLLGTNDRQASAILTIGEAAGLLVPLGTAEMLAATYRALPMDRVVTTQPVMWDDGVSLYRWEPPKVEAGSTATWDLLLSRMSDPEAFLAHVWSIFEPRFTGRQALWLQGEGEDGKSIVVNALIDGAGLATSIINDTDLKGDKFLYCSVWDKPLVILNESKNANASMFGTIHTLTGRDKLPVEYKNGPRFVANFMGVVFVTSNNLPQVENTRANVSRLTVVTMTKGDWIDDLPRRLRAEVPALLDKARGVYARLCPRHHEIKLSDASQALLDETTKADDEAHAATLEYANLVIGGDGRVSRKDIGVRLKATRADGHKLTSFYKWLARQPGVKEYRTASDRGFIGLKERHAQ